MKRLLPVLLALTITLSTSALHRDDKVILTDLLHEFLTGQTKAHHDRFWAEDLVYTSSNGTRFGKAKIMAGFKAEANPAPAASGVTYSATDIDIRLYPAFAIVAFKLIHKEEGKLIQTYWNTGTFKKNDGKWQAVAWQATKIPQP